MKITDTSGQDTIIAPAASKKKWWLVSGAISISLVTLTLLIPTVSRWANAEHSVSAERLRFATVTQGDFVRDVSVQGKVVAAVSPTLYAVNDGTVQFLVQAGESVNKDQLLAVIDSPELSNQLEQEQASLASMQIDEERQSIQSKKQALENQKTVDLALVTLNAAEREMRRAEQAYQRKAISSLDFEKAKDDLQNARLAHRHAIDDAQLNRESLAFELKTKRLAVQRQQLLVSELERQKESLQLKSPVDGIVGQLIVEERTAVNKNSPIISVVDLSQFEIEVQIPESYADDLTLGMEAEIQNGGNIFAAKLVSISPEIQDNQVVGRVRFDQQIPQGLRQNQRLTTRILLELKKDVLMVQRGPFLDAGAGRLVYRVQGDMAEKVSVETGARSLSHVEIVDGLQPGDNIIISNTESFEGAQSVLINQ
ncbi:MAG: efflux RND transporter periplasmic adaptor subunit [Gammaproteobacteria bacterium]|nr:efflux RND transporter periplasmic adaptor subunit [Gammaproteobacteria bacterium]NVK86693.1 efflux RND transporter periplasmic adaptor subunit [Gammaproteobacteria bacterium]